MSERTVYLIRHGKPVYPQNSSCCIGQTDLPLSPLGKMQAVLLNAQLSGEPLQGIFSSPLSRARETALILAGDSSIPVTITHDLQERYMGEWDGLPFSMIRTEWPELYEKRGTDPDLPIPGAEPVQESLIRFQSAIQSILAASEGNIAVVAHTDVISSFAAAYAGAHGIPFEQRTQLRLPLGGYYQFIISKDHTITDWDLVRHQPHPEADDRLCSSLRSAASLPGHIQQHCDAVAFAAMMICDALSARGVHSNRRLIRNAALLHDIARQHKDHASIGGSWLTELGYPEIGNLIASHHNHENPCLDDASILFIADKITQGTASVSLEQRFSVSLQKCSSQEAVLAHKKQQEQACRIAEQINTICQRTIIQITEQ